MWDTGVGVAREHRARIFDDYFQAHSSARRSGEGLGLGLSLVRRICTHQGWRITVENLPSGGSCFRVLLDQA